MLKGFVAVILFILIAIAIAVAVVLRFMYKGVRNLKEIQEEIINTGGKKFSRQEYIRYQRQQSGKNSFDKDYFKSTNDGKKKQTGKQTTTRKTTTDSGVTIIDDRESEEKKKIFDNNDGEYVEFEEIHD